MKAILVIVRNQCGYFLLLLWGGFGPDWATRLGSAFFAIVMLGAIMMVHLAYGWNSINMGMGNMGKGMEFQTLILAISLYFVFKGNSVSTETAIV